MQSRAQATIGLNQANRRCLVPGKACTTLIARRRDVDKLSCHALGSWGRSSSAAAVAAAAVGKRTTASVARKAALNKSPVATSVALNDAALQSEAVYPSPEPNKLVLDVAGQQVGLCCWAGPASSCLSFSHHTCYSFHGVLHMLVATLSAEALPSSWTS